MPKMLVYVVGGPGLPNVPNVKLPIFVCIFYIHIERYIK